MTGSFGFAPVSHERAVLELDDGSRVAYRDVRRFGTWLVLEDADLEPYLAAKNGPEPLGAAVLGARGSRRSSDGGRRRSRPCSSTSASSPGSGTSTRTRRSGAPGVNPLRPANGLSDDEVARVTRAVRAALRAGIERQGSTLRDYAAPDGASGSMQDEFRVYGRDGEPCRRCRTTIAKTRVGGRGTWFCPRCQPLSPRRAD